MLGFVSILDKAQKVWDLITDTAPDAMDQAANFLRGLGDVVQEAAEKLRNLKTDGLFQGSAEDAKAFDKFEELREQVHNFSTQPLTAIKSSQKEDDDVPVKMKKAWATITSVTFDEIAERFADAKDEAEKAEDTE
jgi:hypothetical protein